MMNSEGKFWVSIWSIGSIVLLCSIALLLDRSIERDIILARMVEAGASPIEAACALDDIRGRNPTCVITATAGSR